jgi:glucosyl-3-phosphoglycerate synthase
MVVQPLAGEWAARRELMESLSIPVGYGVELAVLLDTAAGRSLDAVAQVDLGSRAHKHQNDHDLALMAAELMLVAERCRPPTEGQAPGRVQLQQFARGEDGVVLPLTRVVPAAERPPAALWRLGRPADSHDRHPAVRRHGAPGRAATPSRPRGAAARGARVRADTAPGHGNRQPHTGFVL